MPAKGGILFALSIHIEGPPVGLIGEYNSPLDQAGTNYPGPANNRCFHVLRVGRHGPAPFFLCRLCNSPTQDSKLATKGNLNADLHKALRNKNDDFYTQLSDIEKELRHYTYHFKNKVVYCNCDDPKGSQFFQYFYKKFRSLGLRKLITTCYKNRNPDLFTMYDQERAIGITFTESASGDDMPNMDIFDLDGDGDFRSPECVELLKEADIVVTNPPFSLFREYITQLVEHGKQFLIIGNMNAAAVPGELKS